ncbi:hypothetical protein KCP77_01315 [Salmonella enterica subsp. enterica]|nr:hypothetical protein KCP77_01315 [Salmonella enterica subsp. enterica]
MGAASTLKWAARQCCWRIRIVRLFHHASSMGRCSSGTCYRLLCRVRPPVYESFCYLTASS